MSKRERGSEARVPAAARAFGSLHAGEALLPGGGPSATRKGGALFLALLVLAAVPLFWAANAAGVIGDTPAAVAKSNSGPGGGHDDDDNSGPGGGDDDDDTDTARTDQTSANGHSTRGTTQDNDTGTQTRTGRHGGGTNDTSANGHSTRGTTRDNDTRTGTGTETRTGS